MHRKSSVDSPKDVHNEFVPIPKLARSLHQSIIRIQARENVDFDTACCIAASLIEANSETFNKAVDSKANSLYKHRYMTELNKASQSIRRNSFVQGQEEALRYHPLLMKAGWESGHKESLLLRKYTCSKCHRLGILLDSQLQEIEKSLSHEECNTAIRHETLIQVMQNNMPSGESYTSYRKMFEDFLRSESVVPAPVTALPVIAKHYT
jgi:hypothetical protein